MREIQEAASLVQEQAHEDANIIFGASIDESLGENVKVTVIATGFDRAEAVPAVEVRAQQQSAPPTLRFAPSATDKPSQRPEAPAMSRRTAHGHEARTAAAAPPGSQPRLPIRERTRDAAATFPSLDQDWDVPAFQRKNQ
jgi:cell division protein FtsZ